LLPGLTKKETKIILPLLISSLILFGLGLAFSYYTLIPAALNLGIIDANQTKPLSVKVDFSKLKTPGVWIPELDVWGEVQDG
jgi:Sec-independent protein secretion pathway component TatC